MMYGFKIVDRVGPPSVSLASPFTHSQLLHYHTVHAYPHPVHTLIGIEHLSRCSLLVVALLNK